MSKTKAAPTKPGQTGFDYFGASDNGLRAEKNGNGHLEKSAEDFESFAFFVPIGDVPLASNDRPLHIDIRLTRDQSNALRRMLIGLRISAETCHSPTGKRLVNTNQDVVRWLLEQAANPK